MSIQIEAPIARGTQEASLLDKMISGKTALKKQSDIDNALNKVQLYAYVTMKALLTFKARKYAQFDALVGDTACQIRALKVADLAQRFLIDPSLKCEIDAFAAEAFQVLLKSTGLIGQPVCKDKTVAQLVETYNINLKLSNDLIFLVEAYLLTQCKEESKHPGRYWDYTEVMKPSKLVALAQEFLIPCTEGKANVILEEIQKDLADRSVKYLREQGALLPRTTETALSLKYVTENCLSVQSRITSPCIYTMDIVLKRILAMGLKVLLVVQRWSKTQKLKIGPPIKFLYGANRDKTQLILLKKSGGQEDPPVFVVAGDSISDEHETTSPAQFYKKLEGMDINKILYANWASHCLYAGSVNKDAKLPEDQRVEDMKAYARANGCYGSACEKDKKPNCKCRGCSEDGVEGLRLFATNHIYPDSYLNATKEEPAEKGSK